MTLLWLCFLAFSLVVSSVFLDRNYYSEALAARAHGRVGIAMISIKTALTLLFTVAADTNPWFLHAVTLFMGACWLYLWLRYLPSYRQWVNQVWSAFGAVFLWASLTAALARILDAPIEGAAGYVFFLGTPVAAFCGLACAHQRFHSYNSGSLSGGDGKGSLLTPWDVELRVRYILRDVMSDVQQQTSLSPPHGRKAHRVGDYDDAEASGAANSAEDPSGEAIAVAVPLGATRDDEPSGAAQPLDGGRSQRPQQGTPTDAKNAAAIQQAAELFAEGSRMFPQSAMMDLMRANFIRIFINDASEEAACIASGLSKSPGMDVRFLLSQAKHQMEERGFHFPPAGSGGAPGEERKALAVSSSEAAGRPDTSARMGIIERVQFEKLMSESVEYSLRARVSELRFWSELRHEQPNALALHIRATDMSTAVVRASRAFHKLVEMAPNNVDVLQMYAVFLLEVRRENSQANHYFDRADKIVEKELSLNEARRARARADKSAAMSVWGVAKKTPSSAAVPGASDAAGAGKGAPVASPAGARSPATLAGGTGGAPPRAAASGLPRTFSNASGMTAPSGSQSPSASLHHKGSFRSQGGDDAGNIGQTLNAKTRRGSIAMASYAGQAARVRRSSLGTTERRQSITSQPSRSALSRSSRRSDDQSPGQPPPSAMASMVTTRKRDAATKQRDDATDLAAQSLRVNLRAKALTMEPSLKLLRRALTVLFVRARAGQGGHRRRARGIDGACFDPQSPLPPLPPPGAGRPLQHRRRRHQQDLH